MSEKYRLKQSLPGGLFKGIALSEKQADEIVRVCASFFTNPNWTKAKDYPDFFEPLNEKWKLSCGETYWWIEITEQLWMNIKWKDWQKDEADCARWNNGGCFPTKQAAQEMRGKIKELLGGEE